MQRYQLLSPKGIPKCLVSNSAVGPNTTHMVFSHIKNIYFFNPAGLMHCLEIGARWRSITVGSDCDKCSQGLGFMQPDSV